MTCSFAQQVAEDRRVRTTVSIVIPTYQREQVLLNTIYSLLDLPNDGLRIIVVDQTPVHEPQVEMKLRSLTAQGKIEWARRAIKSIPAAMNHGAALASPGILIYVDDDIVPDRDLLTSHLEAQCLKPGDLVAGRVLQPWHEPEHNSDPFTKQQGEFKAEFIGCNFSIARDLLLELGGFDENFKGAAYHFEREFADRLLASGHTIWYEPSALVHHLHHVSGGTRSRGSHLTSWKPHHPVGAYYYLLVSPRVKGRFWKALQRLLRSVLTRHHLRAPWYIPVTLISELTGLGWAVWLRLRGPALPFSQAARATRGA